MCTVLFSYFLRGVFLHDYFSTIGWLTKIFAIVIVVRNSELPQGYEPYIPCIQGADVANTPRSRSPRYTHPKSYRTPYLRTQECFYPYCIQLGATFDSKTDMFTIFFQGIVSKFVSPKRGFDWGGGGCEIYKEIYSQRKRLFQST